MFWTHIRFGKEGMSDSLSGMFFGRAKECPLDVHIHVGLIHDKGPRGRIISLRRDLIIPALSPRQRIKTLTVERHTWSGIGGLIGKWADALPALQELTLNVDPSNLPMTTIVAGGLERLRLAGFVVQGLSHITAPNLRIFKFEDSTIGPPTITILFDFFDATPSLEDIWIGPLLACGSPPPDRKITLPRLRRIVIDTADAPGIASHLVCPSVMDTQLVDSLLPPDDPNVDVFPQGLGRLLGEYSVEVISEVLIHVSRRGCDPVCSLQFRASSGTTFRITYKLMCISEPPNETPIPPILFDKGVSALLSLPLGEVVSVFIDLRGSFDFTTDLNRIRASLAEVFGKCQNLRKVVLESYAPGCFPDFSRKEMPLIRTLIVKHPKSVSWREFVRDVTKMARARHSGGTPLERIEIFTRRTHARIEVLESLVREVKYRETNS